MPSPARWLQIWYADGRKDAYGSFADLFDDAFDLEDLAKQYEAADKEMTKGGITTSYHHVAALQIAGAAYKAEYEQLEREGTLREDWDEQNDDVIEEMEEDGVDPSAAFASYQAGYREVSVQLLADDILERHAEMVEEGDFGDEEEEDGEDEEVEEAEA